MTKQNSHLLCPICGQTKRSSEFVAGAMIREPVVTEIQREHPTWTPNEPICLPCLNRYRADHVRRLLAEEKGELTTLDQEVIQSLREQDSISGRCAASRCYQRPSLLPAPPAPAESSAAES